MLEVAAAAEPDQAAVPESVVLCKDQSLAAVRTDQGPESADRYKDQLQVQDNPVRVVLHKESVELCKGQSLAAVRTDQGPESVVLCKDQLQVLNNPARVVLHKEQVAHHRLMLELVHEPVPKRRHREHQVQEPQLLASAHLLQLLLIVVANPHYFLARAKAQKDQVAQEARYPMLTDS